MPKKPPEDPEIQRILDVMQTLLRVLDLSNREIERRLALSPSYLTRVFTGYVEVKLEHILSIARAMGLTPAEFFEFAYPETLEPPSEAAKTIRARLAKLQPARPAGSTAQPPPPLLSEQEINRIIDARLKKLVDAVTERPRASGE
jgi:transcriptional regulator with XRE-family HTH domain